jgi:hypothetical protein
MFFSASSYLNRLLFLFLIYERPLSAKRFIRGSVPLALVSLRSKSCAGLFMRTRIRDPMEKAALLECFNEEFLGRVRQPCCRCVGVAIGHEPTRPGYL